MKRTFAKFLLIPGLAAGTLGFARVCDHRTLR